MPIHILIAFPRTSSPLPSQAPPLIFRLVCASSYLPCPLRWHSNLNCHDVCQQSERFSSLMFEVLMGLREGVFVVTRFAPSAAICMREEITLALPRHGIIRRNDQTLTPVTCLSRLPRETACLYPFISKTPKVDCIEKFHLLPQKWLPPYHLGLKPASTCLLYPALLD